MAALCLVCAVLTVLVKKNNPEMGMLLALAVCLVVLAALMGTLEEINAFVRQMMDASNLPPDIFVPLIKTLGIAVISRIGADLCRDAGQAAMASLMEMVGSFGAVLVSLPLFNAVWEMLQSML
ncbi:MAG: stage III sporulation protein AD [Clostridiales bacterium]|nr:stage III sporulation protein AD [Candidatus Cacconaster stercorequi]